MAIRKFSLLAAHVSLAASLLISNQVRAAPTTDSNNGNSANNTRGSHDAARMVKPEVKILKFPTAYACGKVWLCPDGWDAIGDVPENFCSETAKYKRLGDPKGELVVPKNAMLKIRPSADVLKNPALLKNLALDSFVFLDLTGAEVDENVLKVIESFPRLRRIELDVADLSDEMIGKMNPSNTLEALFLGKTPITGSTLGHLVRLKRLRALGLGLIYFSPGASKLLGLFPNLTKLDMSNTNLSNSDLESFLPKLTKLRLLELKDCKNLTPAAAKILVKSPKLIWLDLTDTKVTDESMRRALAGHHKIEKVITKSATTKYNAHEADQLFHPLPSF